jgi:hypothetical protein
MDDTRSPATDTSPIQAARLAIWRLFEQGYVDEDMATASLLAVDLGTRRVQRQPGPSGTSQSAPRAA